jgi:hypothetical protein
MVEVRADSLAPERKTAAHRAIQTESANHQSIFDYPSRPDINVWKPKLGYPNTNPRPLPASTFLYPPPGQISSRRSLEPVGGGAGFSRFLSLAVGTGESRTADGPRPNRMYPKLSQIEEFTCPQIQAVRTK